MAFSRVWSAFLAVLAACASAGRSRNKNVLFMLADDGGFEFPMWNNTLPAAGGALERLAKRGVTFDRAYTAVSSCSPSRSAILTGLPTHQNGMYGLHQQPGNFQSVRDITSLPNILNQAGYKTGILGKYHVGPMTNYQFSYGLSKAHCWAGATGNPATQNTSTYCNANYNEVTRNITSMKLRARQFLSEIEPEKPFFLYVGWGDCHRCGFESEIGSFCEFYGSPDHGQGVIPDWKPKFFKPEEVIVPHFLPDNMEVRKDIAGQYTAVNRMDTGIGLLLDELDRAGVADDTLVIYFSDNGVPFPSGKTNLFTQQGMGEPMVVYSPEQHTGMAGSRSSEIVSSLDILPTILDWTGLSYPAHATAMGKHAMPLGQTFLPLLQGNTSTNTPRAAYASHNYHSLYAYYPMRALVQGNFRLVHNIAPDLSFGILEDVYDTNTWAKIVNDSMHKQETGWIYNYSRYKHRPEFELYNIEEDPLSLHNLAQDQGHAHVFSKMKAQLMDWRSQTNDPWMPCESSRAGICSL